MVGVVCVCVMVWDGGFVCVVMCGMPGIDWFDMCVDLLVMVVVGAWGGLLCVSGSWSNLGQMS